jgi:hypothetical protein
MLDKNFFFKVGPQIVACFRKTIFLEGNDIDGNKFKPYLKEYAEAKAANSFKRQATEFKDKVTPVLTGDLLRDWTMRKTTSKGFTFGTLSHGGKVKSLTKKGRVITKPGKAIPDKCNSLLNMEAKSYIDKKLNKQFKKTTRIKINAGK